MLSGLSSEDKIFIREYVAEAGTDEEKTQRREECADTFNVSLPTIRAITAWTKIYADRAKNASETSVENEKQESVLSAVTEDSSVTSGEHVNYDNETKNAWRQRWKEFIDRYMPVSDRQNAKILCLPGKNCLEIPIYLDLGFRAENITGVEGGDEDARKTFLKNADRYSIKPAIGRLEQILSDDPTPYDVVSLDFLGQMSPVYLRIARMLHTNRKALILTNFLAKREQKCIQSTMHAAHSVIYLDNEDFKQHGVELIERKQEEAEEQFQSGNSDLSNVRSAASAFNFYGNIGFYRKEHQLDSKRVENFPIHKNSPEGNTDDQYNQYNLIRQNIRIGIQVVLEMMQRMLITHGIPSGAAKTNTFMAQSLAIRAAYGVGFPMEMKSYRYISSIGRGHSPFESDFIVLNKPLYKYEEARRTVQFIMDTAAEIIEAANADKELPSAYVYDKKGNRLSYGDQIQRNHTILSQDSNGRTISELTLSRFMQDLSTYVDSYQGNVIDRINGGEIFQREEIK